MVAIGDDKRTCGGAGVHPGSDSLKSLVFSREWNVADERASGGLVKLRGGTKQNGDKMRLFSHEETDQTHTSIQRSFHPAIRPADVTTDAPIYPSKQISRTGHPGKWVHALTHRSCLSAIARNVILHHNYPSDFTERLLA